MSHFVKTLNVMEALIVSMQKHVFVYGTMGFVEKSKKCEACVRESVYIL